MINIQVDINQAIARLTRLTNAISTTAVDRKTIPDILATRGKEAFKKASLQRIMTNHPPTVGGPYNTGKKRSIKKHVKANLNAETFFIAFVARSKNAADINIGIDLSQRVGLPIDRYSATAGDWSNYMASRIPYNFAGPGAADALLLRHFGTGTKSLNAGYAGKRLYPNNWRIFAQIQGKDDIRNRFVNVDEIEKALERTGSIFDDYEVSAGDDIDSDIVDIFSESASRDSGRVIGEGRYKSNILSQLGHEAIDSIMSSQSWGSISTSIGKPLIMWHRGVNSYGWFRDYNFNTYQTDINEMKLLIDTFFRQVIAAV